MAIGINGLLNMGTSALFASQAAIQVTGNNVSNVNTVGYSRQALRLQESVTIDYSPGQIGTGVNAKEVFRYFDKFVESAYLDKFAKQRRYEEGYSLMRSVESLFNESNNSPGISSQFTAMLDAWASLADEPDNQAVRAALLEKMINFAATVRGQDASLEGLQRQMDGMIGQEVDRANALIQEIARLNNEIKTHTIAGKNNANTLMDQRDLLVRELSGILDISVNDRGGGDYTITTSSGLLLVQENIAFSLEMKGPRVENNLVHNSTYQGTVDFDGSDGYEYTLQVVTGGIVDTTGDPAGNPQQVAQYRVSLDGGVTWLKDDSGRDILFYATSESYPTDVKNLNISFTDASSTLTAGDKFLISPKSDVYWISPTTGQGLNISTQIYQDGTENNQRIRGGSLAGYLEFRDYRVNEYRDRLAAFTDAVAWEINRLHSQGSGLEKLSHVLGDYRVGYTDVPLGSANAGFKWADRLQAGNITLALYDGNGDPVIDNPGMQALISVNFDPATDSLEDFVARINSQTVMVNGTATPLSDFMTASIVDNRLQITTKTDPSTGRPYSFGFTSDTSGILAGLGVNTVFKGESPTDLALNDAVAANTNLINAGRINGGAEGNSGDNITARAIADLMDKPVYILLNGKGTYQTLNDYYSTIVAKVGSDTQSTMLYAATEKAMADELGARRDEISGVNLDEEMTNLIKFQASYKAAAKLITTADQMLQTLLSIKQ